jgi:hypothetical protein
VDELIAALERWQTSTSNESTTNLRNLAATVPQGARLCSRPAIRQIADDVLGGGAFVVRSLLFDKTPSANWKVAWHQDLTIAVCERRNSPGFCAWSIKAGIPHGQPPVSVLEGMVTLRVHPDLAMPATVR